MSECASLSERPIKNGITISLQNYVLGRLTTIVAPSLALSVTIAAVAIVVVTIALLSALLAAALLSTLLSPTRTVTAVCGGIAAARGGIAAARGSIAAAGGSIAANWRISSAREIREVVLGHHLHFFLARIGWGRRGSRGFGGRRGHLVEEVWTIAAVTAGVVLQVPFLGRLSFGVVLGDIQHLVLLQLLGPFRHLAYLRLLASLIYGIDGNGMSALVKEVVNLSGHSSP